MPGILGVISKAGNCKSDMIKAMVDCMTYNKESDIYTAVCTNAAFGSSTLHLMQNSIFENEKKIICFYGEIFEVQNHAPPAYIPIQKAEIVYQYIEKFGYEIISLFNGAFAMAIYDKQTMQITIANDRTANRRIYYYANEEIFAFSSEAKALFYCPEIQALPDYTGIAEFLLFRQTYNQRTIWKDIRILSNATILTWQRGILENKTYWNLKESFKRNKTKTYKQYVDELHQLLKGAVRVRTPNQDIAMGLSGGLDSRTVLGLLDKDGSQIHSFTYGTENCGDVLCALELSNVYGTDHKTISFSTNDLKRYAKEVVWRTDGAADADLFFHINITNEKRKTATHEVSSVAGDAVSGKYNAITILSLFPHCETLNTIQQKTNFYNRIYKALTRGNIKITDKTVFNEAHIQRLDKQIRQDFVKELEKSSNANTVRNALFQTVLVQQIGRTISVMGGIPSTELVVRYPFLDYNVLDFFCRLPNKFLWGQKAYIQMQCNYIPKASAVPHYVTGKPISVHDNANYLFIKGKEYLKRKINMRSKAVFTSDTYDFKRELLVNQAKVYVIEMITKPSGMMTHLFGDLKKADVERVLRYAQAGDEKSLQQIGIYFNAAILADTFFCNI